MATWLRSGARTCTPSRTVRGTRYADSPRDLFESSPLTVPSLPPQVAFITNSVVVALAIVLCLVLRFFLARDNARMDREEADLYGDDEKDTGSDGVSRIAPAQKQPRYVL